MGADAGWERFEPETAYGRLLWAITCSNVEAAYMNHDRQLAICQNKNNGKWYYSKMMEAPRMCDPCDSLDEAIERAETWPKRSWWRSLLQLRP